MNKLISAAYLIEIGEGYLEMIFFEVDFTLHTAGKELCIVDVAVVVGI